MYSEYVLHYGTIAFAVGINSLSVGISQGLTSYHALNAANRQPHAKNDIMRLALIGMTLIETVAILGVLVALFLLVRDQTLLENYYVCLSEVGIGLAISLTGFVIGIASSIPVQAACHAVARQPFFTSRMFSLMLMTQVLIQTPLISGFLVSLFIQSQSALATGISDSLRLIAAGLSIGLGSIGPAIGLSIFAYKAITAVSKNPTVYSRLLSFTFISQAIIETPIIFCLVIAILLLFVVKQAAPDDVLKGIIYIAAALCTGLATLGPGISSGTIGGTACANIAQNPDNYGPLSRSSMLAQGLIETVVIYAVVLSFIMLIFL